MAPLDGTPLPSSVVEGEILGLAEPATVAGVGTAKHSAWQVNTTADADGRFRFDHLRDGAYRFVALPQYNRIPEPNQARIHGPLPMNLELFVLNPGGQKIWTPSLEIGALYRVTARLKAPYPLAASGLQCRIAFELDANWEQTRDLPCVLDGQALQLPWLPEGGYRLEVTVKAPSQPGSAISGRTRFRITGGDVDGLRLELRPN